MAARIYLCAYTIQEDWKSDPISAMEKVKKMGYEGMEIDILVDEELFITIKYKLKELGLAAVGTHIAIDDLVARIDLIFDRMKQVDMKYLGIPWLADECLPSGKSYEETKAKIRYIAERCRLEGITFHYHNHNFEFEKINGVCKQDIFLQDIPELGLQLDVCWCTVGGQDPAAYIRHYGHKTKVLHLKDFDAQGDITNKKLFDLLGQESADDPGQTRDSAGFRFTPLGLGKVDFPSIFKASDEVGIVWMGVEQDASPDRPPMEAAKISIDYIKETYK